ncbi:MAG: AMP-binding protein [Candidatus Omnitrophica bacterium]|nr:AMP-binding protein [Candidatus Omnitrophota bacterium]
MEYSLTENFIKSVNSFQHRVAVEARFGDRRQTLTYAQLGKKVQGLAYFMSNMGIKHSDRVAIILENRPEWVITFFALSYIGAVAVPLDPQLGHKDIKNILSDSGARICFISKEFEDLYRFIKELDGIERLISLGIGENIGPTPPSEFEKAKITPDDLMVLLYTSGTTDLPKGVMLTHKNLCANFDSLNKSKLFSYRDVMLSVLPLYHSYPLMTTLILPVLSGARIVYVGADWPERLVDYLRENNISIFIGVPQIFHMMHSRLMKKLNSLPALSRLYVNLVSTLGLGHILLPKLRKAFGSNFRFFASGGAKLDEAVSRDFLRLGFKILEGYGLTETAPVVSFNPLKDPKPGSVGRALPDVRLKIIDKDSNGIGEIAIQGPNVMKGYYKDDEKTKKVFKDGWFLSGDLGYIDKDGYLYITGRSKEVIVLSSGKNIYPEEIEREYAATPYVKEMCVLGVLKDKGKAKIEYLHAIVVPDLEFFKERGEMNLRIVIKNTFDNISKVLPSHKHIMGFTITKDSLPRTLLGKIKRYEVEKKFLPVILDEAPEEEDVLSGEDKSLSETEIAQRLIKCLQDSLEIKGPISLGDSIELDLGIDSLGRVEAICAIEKCFDIQLSEEMAGGEIFTVKDLLFNVQDALKREYKEHPDARPISWPEILKQPLSAEFQKKILLYPDRFDYVLTFIVKAIICMFFRIFYNLKVEGAEKLPKRGPYCLCVNHVSFFDGLIVAAGVPFKIELGLFFIGFRRYFIVPIVRNLVRRARIIPIDATEIIEAMQSSYFILRHDKALCIFPEGERSIDGKVKEFKKGIGIISKELDIPLVPVYIKGAFEAWPRVERFPRMHPIEIKFGGPVYPEALIQKGISLGAKDDYEAISLGIREEVDFLSH